MRNLDFLQEEKLRILINNLNNYYVNKQKKTYMYMYSFVGKNVGHPEDTGRPAQSRIRHRAISGSNEREVWRAARNLLRSTIQAAFRNLFDW